jgi:segregation and condensation protein A
VAAPPKGDPGSPARTRFTVDLDVFDGPFDVLLALIARKQLDIVSVSLTQVATEFVAYVRQLDAAGRLEESSQFLVIAATLLDMKAASLLPRGEVVDQEEVAALEARDVLFARLLQYRAFKQAAAWMARSLAAESTRHPRRSIQLAAYRRTGPRTRWTTSVDDFAAIALAALSSHQAPTIGLEHLHAPAVSIREQAAIVVVELRRRGAATFTELIAGVDRPGVVVARFLALLELYREAAVSFDQVEPLGLLRVRWTAERWTEENLSALGADYDR